MKKIILGFFLPLFLFAACGKSLEKEVVSTHSDGKPQKINYFRWHGNQKEVVKEVRLFPNGEKEMEGEIKDGKKHGKWTYWNDENGRKWFEETYINGQRNGETTVWYMSGEKEYQGFYKNGIPDGKWEYWNENGKHTQTVYYKNGKIVKTE